MAVLDSRLRVEYFHFLKPDRLQSSQLGYRLVLGELARKQLPQNVPHSPASTSRIRCQWVPAQ